MSAAIAIDDPASEAPAALVAGSPAFLRMAAALVAVGFSIFTLLYCPQALLPLLAHDFGQDAAGASLAVSAATFGLALALIPAGLVTDRIGRKATIAPALLIAAALTVAGAFAPNWPLLVLSRALAGIALAGAPAAAMAFVGEEVEPTSAGTAMGLYIGATAFGGMAARLGAGFVAEVWGWRGAMLAAGGAGLIAAALFVVLLPKARRFTPRVRPLAQVPADVAAAFRKPGLAWLFALSFLLMGGFVTVFNYGGFRLSAAPYGLGPAQVGAVFGLYLVGVASSAMFGVRVGRKGYGRPLIEAVAIMLLGVVVTLVHPLWGVVFALGVLTFGFFGAHAAGSAWVSRLAGEGRAQAAALYLVFYYTGSSILGSAGGVVWERAGWPGVTVFVVALEIAALLIAVRLRASAPASRPPRDGAIHPDGKPRRDAAA